MTFFLPNCTNLPPPFPPFHLPPPLPPLSSPSPLSLPPSSLCRDCELVAFLILGLVLPNFRLMTDALISSTVAVGRSDATLICILRSLRSRSARRKVQLQLTVNTINVSTYPPQSHCHCHCVLLSLWARQETG